MRLNGEQRTVLNACADDLKALTSLSHKIAIGWANPSEERRAAEIAGALRSELSACAEILRKAAD